MQESAESKPSLSHSVPLWILAILLMGVVAMSAMAARRDMNRERDYLQDLFRQKGEILLRSIESGARMGWLDIGSDEELTAYKANLDSPELMDIAITDKDGKIYASSLPEGSMEEGGFAPPEPVGSFKPFADPSSRVSLGKDGQRVFWVYRPLWFTVDPSKSGFDHRGRGRGHYMGGNQPQGRPPRQDGNRPQARPPRQDGNRPQARPPRQDANRPQARPPRQDGNRPQARPPRQDGNRPQGRPPRQDGRDHDRPRPEPARNYPPELYAWLGFDMAPFQAAESAARGKNLLSIVLTGLASLAGVLALFWAQSSRLNKRLYENTSKMASAVFSRLPVGLLVGDLSDRVIFVNPAMERISGLEAGDFLGDRLESLAYGALPKSGEFSGVETVVSFRGGKSSLVSLSGAPVIGQGGKPVGRVLLMADLGELGRLKAELAKNERLATMGSMAGGLAHELRNPLGAIKGLTHYLMQREGLSEQEREALDVMLTSVGRLDSTITDFLEYARPARLNTGTLSLGSLLTKLRGLLIHDPESGSVRLELSIPKEDAYAKVDEAKLSQAFLNLFLNAIQACSANPPDRPGHVLVTLEPHAPVFARISFADNGPGFSEEQLAKPFVPYVTGKAKGTGLGLAIAKKTIEAHEGQLLIGNQEGGGAIVTVVLPLDSAPKGAKASVADTAHGLDTVPEGATAKEESAKIDGVGDDLDEGGYDSNGEDSNDYDVLESVANEGARKDIGASDRYASDEGNHEGGMSDSAPEDGEDTGD
ncbi:MAG: PAS domain-containing protein [Deltaproteobacteria bacterium]|jgi:signal transduction histidine kinase|nr:PAS domain-containing protein [Deltaproteobacteria bacterium]